MSTRSPGQPEAFRPAEVIEHLKGTRFRMPLVHERLDSTIDECRRLADQGEDEGLVVIAEEQTAGRGQRGRTWHSPKGAALYLSALLRPPVSPDDSEVLISVAGVAAAEAALELGAPVRLKHPNDVVVHAGSGRRKLAGLLVDTTVQGATLKAAVVSVGMNVHQAEEDFPPDLRSLATSLALTSSARPSREEAAAAFLKRLEVWRSDMDRGGDWMDRVRRRHEELT